MNFLLPHTKGHLSNVGAVSSEEGWPYKRGILNCHSCNVQLMYSLKFSTADLVGTFFI